MLVLVLRGGDDEEPARTGAGGADRDRDAHGHARPPPPRSPTRSRCAAPAGGKAKGAMTVFLQDGQLGFALQATGVPRNSDGDAYAVWFTGPGDKAVRLGFTNPSAPTAGSASRVPAKQGAAAFPRQYASYSTRGRLEGDHAGRARALRGGPPRRAAQGR